MTERLGPQAIFKQRAVNTVEEVTRAHFSLASQDNVTPIDRLNSIIACEEAHQFTKVMGVSIEELIKAHIRGTPQAYRQDYLDVIYDNEVIESGETDSIAQEFGLIPPSLGI